MLINIKDYPELVKDPNTGLIINRDNITRKKYKTQRQKNEDQLKRIENLESQVKSIDDKLDQLMDLKDMITKMVGDK